MRIAACLLLFATSAANADPLPPPARAVPLTESRAGVAINDPYRWMEEPAHHDEMIAWVRAQSDAATARLAHLPARAEIATLLDGAMRAGTRYSDVRRAGGMLFYRQADAADRVPRLMVRDAAGARVLFDPQREAAGSAGAASINNYSVSPDGRTAAVHISSGGGEVGAIRFLETATGREVLERVSPVWGEFRIAWLDDGKVAVTKMAAAGGADVLQNMVAVVGTPGGSFTAVLGSSVKNEAVLAPTQLPIITTTPTSDWALAIAANAGADYQAYVATRRDLAAGAPHWRPVAVAADKVRNVSLRGDDLYLLNFRTSSNGQVTRQPVAGGPAAVVDIPPDIVINEIEATRSGLYLIGQQDGASRLLFLPDGHGPAQRVALPFESDIGGVEVTGDGSALTLTLEGWTTASRSFRVDGDQLVSLGLDSASWAGAAGVNVRRDWAVSADGTLVPMVIIAKSGAGPRRALLEAYGSYGEPSTTPWYNPVLLAWSARGNVMAYCGTRGGNERGRAWHEAGRERNKPNAHADYVACARRLVALGLTTPPQLAATGTSAGGLLAPVAVQLHPELFGALLPRVAILNPSRLEAAQNGPNQYPEMGDPREPAGFRALVAQDAYLALDRASALPPTLLTIGINDRRVAPWMGAKFAAKGQARFGPDAVRIRADAEAGHGIGSARDRQVAEWADVLGWLESILPATAAR